MLLDAGCLKSICDRGRLETEGWGPVVYTNADGHFKSELEPFEVIRAFLSCSDDEHAMRAL